MSDRRESIVLGGGCFWCTEAVLRMLPGVTGVTVGYAGGFTADPTYEAVCSGTNGHAEVVLVEYDPEVVTLETVLDAFFASHDPTSVDQQGNDVGTQYRSIVLFRDEQQRERVERFMDGVREQYASPVATQVQELGEFYPGEQYHQRYFEKHPGQGYCQFVVAPKVAKMKKKLAGKTG